MQKAKSFFLILIILFSSGLKLKDHSVGVSFLEIIFLFVLIKDLVINKLIYKGVLIKLIFGIIFIQLLSLLLLFNFELVRVLYALRFLEYFLIGYYIWYTFKNKISMNTLIAIFTVTSLLFLINNQVNATYLYLPFSYIWEASTFFSFFGVLFLDYFKNKKGKLLFLVCLILVIYTDQRSPLIAMVITYIYIEVVKGKKIVLISVITLTVIFFGFHFFKDSRLFVFIKYFSFEDVKLAVNIAYENALTYNSYDEFVYGDRSVLTENGDLSLHLRLKKWTYAIKDMDSFIRVVFGNGPGYFGGAADSSILRIFFETGILGVILWYTLLAKFIKKTYFPFVLCVIINSIFIDTFYSSKIMFLTVLIILFYEDRSRTSSVQ